MPENVERILTTHVGSLPRPEWLLESFAAEAVPPDFDDRLRDTIRGVVERQIDVGLDIVNDGEYSKSTGARRPRYGHLTWVSYIHDRLSGFEWTESEVKPVSSKDRARFASFYDAPLPRDRHAWTCAGPVEYIGQEAVRQDIENLTSALPNNGGRAAAFLPVASPTSVQALFPNRYYDSDLEYGWALAEAMRHEYGAIADAGLIVQVDDPVLAAEWDAAPEDLAMIDYRRVVEERIEVLNHALRAIPEQQIRYHMCWGGWHGPHGSDIELEAIVDLILRVRAGAYSLEAANPRHEHEWRVWHEHRLPEGKALIPGVVTHKSDILEHPDVVADRICRYAEVVGRENVIASTDCGLGGRTNEQLAWAKLESLVEGARRASERLWA
jgi:5-methyltetrahydropteroyltriglutamate--homocysteine methyltransferase